MRVYGVLTQRPRRLQGMDVRLMAQRTAVSIDRARAVLDWSPRTSIDDGMAVCEAWLRREGHLPADDAAVEVSQVSRARQVAG